MQQSKPPCRVQVQHMISYMRIKKIHIKDYKGIDELSLAFPGGVLPDDPDVCIIGSKNGVGKTCLLECCAMLIMAAKGHLNSCAEDKMDIIRGGAERAFIEGCLEENGQERSIELTIDAKGDVKITPAAVSDGYPGKTYMLKEVLGLQPDPIISEGVIFMHGFRKIREESPALGMILRNEDNQRKEERYWMNKLKGTPSPFKQTIIKYLMASANLFDDKANDECSSALHTLDSLLRTYAEVSLGKIRLHEDNTMDIMVKGAGKDGMTFPIDGLSSGQKEIISTLFLIWDITRKDPHVVLIDEPELHLNSQWHKKFVHELLKISPNNQYIMATHSEQIMSAVESESRILLERHN